MSKIKNFQEEFALEDIKIAKDVVKTYDCGLSRIALKAPTQRVKVRQSLFQTPDSAFATADCITLRLKYAIEVWNKAALISADNPGDLLYYWWLHFKDTDGPFRVIEYNNFYKNISVQTLIDGFWKLLEDTANSGEITVSEGYHIYNQYTEYNEPHITCEIVADAAIAHVIYKKVNDIYRYPFDNTPRSYRWEEIKDLFVCLSLDQLRLTHIKELHRHSKLDDALLLACSNFDIDAINMALDKGAYIHCLNEYGQSVLQKVVESFEDCHLNKDIPYSEEEKAIWEQKCKQTVELLLKRGADINLFGAEGNTPLDCLSYSVNLEMVDFLLKKGADPNINCYLFDSDDWTINSNIRSSIMYSIADDYDNDEDYNQKMEQKEIMLHNAGGRAYKWGYVPWESENIGRYVIRMTLKTNQTDIFVDNAGWFIGDCRQLKIEDANDKITTIDLSAVDGLQEWADDYQQNIKQPLHYDWTAWRTRGLDIAQRIAELLPPTAALYYLADGAISFETYGDDATPYMRIAGNVTRIV